MIASHSNSHNTSHVTVSQFSIGSSRSIRENSRPMTSDGFHHNVPGEPSRSIARTITMKSNNWPRIRVIDTHTGGEPTRVVFAGGPDLGAGSLAERRARFRDRFDP